MLFFAVRQHGDVRAGDNVNQPTLARNRELAGCGIGSRVDDQQINVIGGRFGRACLGEGGAEAMDDNAARHSQPCSLK